MKDLRKWPLARETIVRRLVEAETAGDKTVQRICELALYGFDHYREIRCLECADLPVPGKRRCRKHLDRCAKWARENQKCPTCGERGHSKSYCRQPRSGPLAEGEGPEIKSKGAY